MFMTTLIQRSEICCIEKWLVLFDVILGNRAILIYINVAIRDIFPIADSQGINYVFNTIPVEGTSCFCLRLLFTYERIDGRENVVVVYKRSRNIRNLGIPFRISMYLSGYSHENRSPING